MGVTGMQEGVLSTCKHIHSYARRSALDIVGVLCQPIGKATGKPTKRHSEGLSSDGDVHSELHGMKVNWLLYNR